MCGRIIQHSPPSAYADLFGIEECLGETPPRYNLAPSQPMLVARTAPGGKPELTYLRWGLVPSWSKGPDSRFSLINARVETVAEKPAYRGPFRYRRCLIPTEGFYEWKPAQGGKQPYLIRMRSGAPFALAGLWDHWQDPNGSELETCTIIVTEANSVITPIHDRMPVILPPEVWDTWLDPHQQDSRALRSLLVACDPEPMEAFPVSWAVNNTRNDEPSLIEPV
jgi:putative SOS response-associated peptidase YedK